MIKNRDSAVITDIDGTVLRHYGSRKTADQPPLIALNGLGSGIEPWGDFLHDLDRHVVAVDVRRTVGRCAIQNPFFFGGYLPHMSDYASALKHALFEHHVIEPGQKADILGFSWGSHLAARAVADSPNDFRKLIIAAGSPGVQVVSPDYPAIEALSQPNRTSVINEQFTRNVYGGELGRHPELAETLGIKREIDPVLYYRQLAAISMSLLDVHDYYQMRLPLSAQMAMLQHDTLVMAGDDDPITPYQNAKVFNMMKPNSQLHTAEGDGHYFLLTNPKQSAEAVNSFLDEK